MNSLNSEHFYQYGTKMINYSLVRSKRVKTCEIIINDENNVMIRSPYSKPIVEIENLIKHKVKWISRKQIEFKEKEHKVEIIKPTFVNNSTVPYMGNNLKLNIIESHSRDKDTIEFKRNQFFAFIKTDNKVTSDHDITIETRVKSLYEKWITTQSKHIFKEKVLKFSRKILVNPSKITIKNLKNRWGSATEKGTINLNINLLKAPENVIDYIIIHELCHLKIKKHSHHFWNLVSNYVPDYKNKVNWLEINSKSLVS
jgi:predicted metal-dependent hydrolase